MPDNKYMAEVDVSEQMRQALETLTTYNEWEIGMLPYLEKVLSAKRGVLEDRDDPLVRGECKRIRKLLRLREDVLAAKGVPRPETAARGG